jgi:hypothetical protein
MGWIASFGIALLTGLLAMLGAGTVAAFIVEWYNVSSFEGGSAFLVVGLALVGLIAGFLIGLVVSRAEARQPRPRFAEALGISGGAVAVILLVIGAVSWMLADIPPRIDGEELFLLTELRWPASGGVAPDGLSGAPYVRLGATRGSVVRRLENGPLFMEDARREDGRWVVGGAAPIFTSRGGRFLQFSAGDESIAAFMAPVPRYPSKAQSEWSGWLPAARPGEPALPDQFSYRFRVIRRSEPLRTQHFGPFEIETVADYFYNFEGSDRLAAQSTFRVKYHGQPLSALATAQSVAVVGGPKPALFVTAAESSSETPCALVSDEGSAVRVQWVKSCGASVRVRAVTADRRHFAAAKASRRLPGWIDVVSFAEPGLFRLDSAVVDTRDFSVAEISFPLDSPPDTETPPLSLSPDEKSLVWLARGSEEKPRLGVTNWRTGQSYLLLIDRARMRYSTEASLDPDWVQHHFEWRPGTGGGDAADMLVERPDFTPLPYRGDLSLGKPGAYQSYSLHPGGEPLRRAIVDLLVTDLGGERLPDESGGFVQHVRVNGKVVGVSVIGSPTYVSVSMDDSDSDPQAMSAIGARLDLALASGRYDSLFVSQ